MYLQTGAQLFVHVDRDVGLSLFTHTSSEGVRKTQITCAVASLLVVLLLENSVLGLRCMKFFDCRGRNAYKGFADG